MQAWSQFGLPVALVDTRSEYDHLFSIYVPIAVGVFLVIVLAVASSVVIFRRRRVENAARWHEHNLLEASYALLLACVAAFLLYLTFTAEHRVDTAANRERPAVTIDTTGSKWEWTFTYAGFGFSIHSGTVGHQPLVVPAGEAVRFNLTSADVIHSFWIPALRYKRDAIPGTTEVATLFFSKGVFAGQCAEFCGLRHADMIFTAHAVAPSAFAAWARSHGRSPTP